MWSFIALLLLALPRFFLIPINDTGIRTEDILLLALVPATIQLLVRQREQMGPVVKAFGVYFGIVALASVVAGLTGTMPMVVALAFGLRPALYACGFVVGWHLGLHGRHGRKSLLDLCVFVLWLNLAWGLGAAIQVLPNLASFAPSRLSGITNGPYELSAMACLISVALLWYRRLIPAAAGVLALIWTQSRIALAAFVLQVAWTSLRGRSWIRVMLPVVAVALLVMVVGLRDSGGVSLSESLSSMSELVDDFSSAALSQDDYFDAAYSDSANSTIGSGEGDPSALLRVARWSVVWATARYSAGNLWLGMGPGYYSVALDGNYVRLLGETGLLGLFSYLWVGVRLKGAFIKPQHRRLMALLLGQMAVVAIFIDVFVSLKTMCLFWMMVGALQREDQEGTE